MMMSYSWLAHLGLLLAICATLTASLSERRRPHPRVYVYNLGPKFREGGIRDELEAEASQTLTTSTSQYNCM